MSEDPALGITVNGRPEQLHDSTTVAELVRRLCPSPNGVAVARNRDVVPRSQWHDTPIETGDRIEIVTAAAGG